MSSVDCSNCHRPLQLPPGANVVRCVMCQAITRIPVQFPSEPTPPPPVAAAPTGSLFPSVHNPKRAVICGICYKGKLNSKYELKSCINDAKCMKYLLVHKFNFPESHIIMLNEEETDPLRLPTKANILAALSWLVQGCQSGDSLVFHYSGHGSQWKDDNGDEKDGYDETLCPLDFLTEGMIIDDEINARIVRPLPPGVKLHAIIDACHSGTMLDLPYLCKMDRRGNYVWEDQRLPTAGVLKGTSGGEVFCFSGCNDDQTSADASALSQVTSTGPMTYSFIQSIYLGYGTTYQNMLCAMRSIIQAYIGLDDVTRTSHAWRQEPQLTSSEEFNIISKRFSL